MIKIVLNIKKKLAVLLVAGLLIGQGSGYLAQKLMVENNIRERVKDALSKIIDNNKYVINVDIDLEISDEFEEQITVLSERDPRGPVSDDLTEQNDVEESLSSIQQTIESEEESSKSSYSVGLPIPGFEMDFTKSNKSSKKAEEPKPPVISAKTKKPIEVSSVNLDSNEPKVDKIITSTRPSRAEIKKMYISLILQEGAAPELIENIRQLTMAAAKFDRNRGDKLTIMTASFREKRDQRSAEQIMLKNIAEKIELLEQKREIEENTQDATWKDELTRYREEESVRREDDRKFFEGQISQLEQQAKDRAYAQEKKDMLLRDSLKLKKLNDELVALKAMLKSAEKRDSLKTVSKQERIDSLRYVSLSSELDELAKSLQVAVSSQSKDEEVVAKRKIKEEMADRERQKEEREKEIADKIRELDSVQEELDRLHQDMEKESGNTFIILIVLGVIVFFLIAALVFILLRNNNRQAPVPPWMMPPPPRKPRRRKRGPSNKEKNSEETQKNQEPASKPQSEEPVVTPPAPQPEQSSQSEVESSTEGDSSKESTLPSSDDDPDVVRSEINDIRKSVVSMSVGQPDRTTTIVKEWLEQPEPTPPAEPEQEASSDSDSGDTEEKEK
ncbi:MAG: flagellar M-ring protein FliF C-terminal domain-containing protein [Candidatus Neomarinimicrobiota bacterium]